MNCYSYRKGSVIVDLMIDYNFINREQLVQIIDRMDETKMFGNVALGYFSVNSSRSMFCGFMFYVLLLVLNF